MATTNVPAPKWTQLYLSYVFLEVLLLNLQWYDIAEASNEASEKCSSKGTCGECIAENSYCAWCAEEDSEWEDKKRCGLIKNLATECNHEDIMYPDNSMIKIAHAELGSTNSKGKEKIQIKPQEILLKIRPKTPITIPVEFRQATDYPVDLYYVMDLSYSMLNDKMKLAELGNKLASEMGSITSNFRIGFGSFVDKVTAPYVNVHPEKLRRPCAGCAPPFGFRNNMPLSLDTHQFAQKVRESDISGNLDGVEGGFDAIMQAIVCKKEIGWRSESRKILVLSTDNGFHLAGDGKLAGIIQPNDEKCHLDKDGYYNMTTKQDYPSLSQLNRIIKENNVIIIFAVTGDQVGLYKKLNGRLLGSITGRLEGDSSNVVEFIREQYEEITSSVKLTTDLKSSSNVKVSFESRCLGEVKQKTDTCKGLRVDTNVTFDVTIELTNCPRHDISDWNKTFEIHPVGLSDSLIVHLESLCECDCEKPWNEMESSERCNGKGTHECGICSCSGSAFGKTCECDGTGSNPDVDEAECSQGNDTEKCSGQGDCVCGICRCYKPKILGGRISGTFCECNDFGCDKQCNGPDHGECLCGKCECHSGWKGPDCGCSVDQTNCLGDNGEICSGHGTCECGLLCRCEPNYFGKNCDDCLECMGKCTEVRPCVDCFFENITNAKTDSNCSTCSYSISSVETLEIEGEENEKECTFEDEQNCRFYFKYKVDDHNQPIVYVKKEKDCPLPVNAMAIISGVTGSIVGAGLLLLFMWKLLTTIHDRRELAKFEKEAKKAKWDAGENPLYKGATSTFANPVYGED